MVPRPGFEPGSTGRKPIMIDRTTLPGQWGVPFLAGLKTFAPSGSEMRGLGGGWWTGRDLNPGPRVCKTRDLPLIYRPI